MQGLCEQKSPINTNPIKQYFSVKNNKERNDRCSEALRACRRLGNKGEVEKHPSLLTWLLVCLSIYHQALSSLQAETLSVMFSLMTARAL